ncbi:MAG: hypothetical protein LBC61_02555 [Candidatus Peribacteria bacterium]|nr:hypothetical protein [Candidatus Peribacteria bacterium]
MFSKAFLLLKSMYLCLYLISSFASSPKLSNSKGGVLDFDKQIVFFTIISISPVFKFGLLCHSGLTLTIHSI